MFVKRAFLSLKHGWVRSLALVLLFAVVFSATLGLLISYISIDRNVKDLQYKLGSAVTLMPVTWMGQGEQNILGMTVSFTQTQSFDVREADAELFAESEYVAGYNYVGTNSLVDVEGDLRPVLSDDNRAYYEDMILTGNDTQYQDGNMQAVLNSEYTDAFTFLGYELTRGRHFTAEDEGMVLISEEYAKLNDLELGDEITFSTPTGYMEFAGMSEEERTYLTLTICGMFSVPDKEDNGYSEINLGTGANDMYFGTYSDCSVFLDFTKTGQYISWVTVYLKDPVYADAFVEEVQGELAVEEVKGSVKGSGYRWTEGMTLEEFEAAQEQQRTYDIYLDRELYDYVASPMEATGKLVGAFLVALISGSLIILLLIVALLIRGRRREFGILLSMGESKAKLAGQVCIEILVPLLLAAVVGLIAGRFAVAPMVESYSSQLLGTQVQDAGADRDSALGEIDDDMTYEAFSALDAISTRNPTRAVVESELDFEIGSEIYLLYFGIAVAAMILALLVQLIFMLRVDPAKMLTRKE